MNTLKIIFIIFFPLYMIQTGYSQEKTHFKCAYKFDFLRDTIAFNYFRQETYIVQIGDKMTKGFTYQKFYNDSLKTSAPHLYEKLFKTSVAESIEAMRRTGDISHVHNNAFSSGAFASDLYKDYAKIPKTTQRVDRKEFIRAKMGAKGARISESDMAQVGLSSTGNQQKKLYDYIERDYK